jgi:hypothetical protein
MTAASAARSVAAAATPTAFTSASAASSAAALGKRHVGRASRNPERAETCGKSQNHKPSDKLSGDRAADLFADERSHDVFLPLKVPFAHNKRDCDVRVPSLRKCDAALHARYTLEAARPQQTCGLHFRFCQAIWRKSDQKPDRMPPLASRFCAWPFVIDTKSTECRARANATASNALSPECHKARPKAATHMSHHARDCHWITASACSSRGLGSS